MPRTHIVSFSELDSFRQCPFKHELAYKERWQKPTASPALVRGTAWHEIMDDHYRTLKTIRSEGVTILPNVADRTIAAHLYQAVAPRLYDERGRQTEQQELLEWMYRGYVDKWGDDPDWKILAIEHAAVVWLPTDRGGRSNFQIKLKIDLVAKHIATGHIWIWDHKTGKDLPTEKELDFDDQFGLYTWGMKKLGKPILGSCHNAVRTQRNKDQDRHPQTLDSRFKRTRLFRNDAELDTIAVEAYKAARRAYSIPVGEADRATNSDTCKWRCDYRDACLASRKGIAPVQELLRDTGYEQNFERH